MSVMAGYLGVMYYVRMVRNALRRERVFRDRLNSFDRYNDLELSTSTVLLKESVNNFINLFDVIYAIRSIGNQHQSSHSSDYIFAIFFVLVHLIRLLVICKKISAFTNKLNTNLI